MSSRCRNRAWNRVLACAALAVAVPSHAQQAAAPATAERGELALMGTIPIYWGEAAGIGEVLAGAGEAHWARAALEREYRLVPLDYLSEQALAAYDLLLLAQPRGLAAQENVALDAWVRAGGRLLLFADPLMTGETRFPLGDRRRPQDVALLSPILAHWGLELRFDETQPSGPGTREFRGNPLPVDLAGEFALVGDGEDCALSARRLVARCRLGAGEALIVADAALLDIDGPRPCAENGLRALLSGIFGENRGEGDPPVLTIPADPRESAYSGGEPTACEQQEMPEDP